MRKTNTCQHVSCSTSVHRNHRGSHHDPNLLIITLCRLKPVGTAESPPVAWWYGPNKQDGNDNRLSAVLLQANHLKSKMFPKAVSILNPLKKTRLYFKSVSSISVRQRAVCPIASLNASSKLGNILIQCLYDVLFLSKVLEDFELTEYWLHRLPN